MGIEVDAAIIPVLIFKICGFVKMLRLEMSFLFFFFFFFLTYLYVTNKRATP